jgi:xylan 1,4-beta-xylosidase
MVQVKSITISTEEPGRPYVPIWKKLICAGRAAEALREDWREQCRTVQEEIGFEYIRFHGIFHDDMMVYRERKDGTPVYNFLYVDKVFDFLRSVGLKPFVELGFMPTDLASGEQTVFYWQGNVSPPKEYERWAGLVRAFANHCIKRYGIEEVATWYFEVWNEPNVPDDFWAGDQKEYFALYRSTAEAIKSVSPDLRVGGPASSFFVEGEPPWVEELISFCEEEGVALDFVTTHPYPVAWPVEGPASQEKQVTYRGPDATPEDLRRVSEILANSRFPTVESHVTEWNSSFICWDLVHDTAFMAPFVIRNNLDSVGLADSLGYWTFTDVFEEHGAGEGPFHGGFGLINHHGIKKPAFFGYKLLARLGERMVDRGERYVVTRSRDAFQVLLWNYVHYSKEYAAGERSSVTILDRDGAFELGSEFVARLKLGELNELLGPGKADGSVSRVPHTVELTVFDPEKNSAYEAWLEMGHPQELAPEDVDYLKGRAVLRRSHITIPDEGVEIAVPPHGAVLVEIALAADLGPPAVRRSCSPHA